MLIVTCSMEKHQCTLEVALEQHFRVLLQRFYETKKHITMYQQRALWLQDGRLFFPTNFVEKATRLSKEKNLLTSTILHQQMVLWNDLVRAVGEPPTFTRDAMMEYAKSCTIEKFTSYLIRLSAFTTAQEITERYKQWIGTDN